MNLLLLLRFIISTLKSEARDFKVELEVFLQTSIRVAASLHCIMMLDATKTSCNAP